MTFFSSSVGRRSGRVAFGRFGRQIDKIDGRAGEIHGPSKGWSLQAGSLSLLEKEGPVKSGSFFLLEKFEKFRMKFQKIEEKLFLFFC